MNARFVYGIVCMGFGIWLFVEAFTYGEILPFSDRARVAGGAGMIFFIGVCFIDSVLLDRSDRRRAERKAAAGKEEENQRREWSRNPPKRRSYYTDM